jgi:predicted nucleic acid-binding protein
MVVDVSMMACWHFADERNAKADAILARLQTDQAAVPGLWWFEMRNVLLQGERRRRTTPQQTAAFLEFLREIPISVALLPDENAVMELARPHRLSFYDAAYLDLALREGFPLATFDGDLIAAARAESVPLA